MKYILLIPIVVLLFSCGNSKEIAKEVQNDTSTIKIDPESEVSNDPDPIKPQRNVMIKGTIGSFKETDAFDIQDVTIKGNTLLLTITYSGGCADHKFEFIGSSVIMKSLPPIRSVRLIHDAADDACESLVTRIIEVDLKNIAYTATPGTELNLMLKGWDTKINYIYE
tara:strand:- start:2760 stop:3260 length:501 start_codon:yes stop_codon:yes gene_type:complete